MTRLPASPLDGIRTIELTHGHEEILQRFFDANPAYFEAVMGEPASAHEAHDEIHGELPSGWSFTKKWIVGYVDDRGQLVAMANVVSDLLAAGVWHIGLFIVDSARQGRGDAHVLYRALETWAIDNGARWLRLGVVQGNARAERFWLRHGYVDTRTREGVEMGRRTNTIRVMVKALSAAPIEDYLARVERDRPQSA
jgi:GNAT superfamily N-acetyltransferase